MIDQTEQYSTFPAQRLQEILSSLELKIKANRKQKCSEVVSELIQASQLLDSYARKYTFGDRITQGYIKRFDVIMSSLQKKASSPIQIIKSLFNKNPCRQSFQRLSQFYSSQLYSKVLQNLDEENNASEFQQMKKQLKTHKQNILNESSIKQQLNQKPFNIHVQQITTIQDATQQDCRLHQIYQQLVDKYKDHQIDQCWQLTKIYDNMLKNCKHPKEAQQKLKHSPEFINKVKKQYENMDNYYSNFLVQGWNLEQQQKLKTGHISFYTKYFAQNDQIGFMIEGQFDIPVQNFLAILTQIDLMDKYIPFAFDTKEIKKIDRNHKIGLARVYLPLLNDRQIFFSAYGYNRIKKNGSIFVYSRTITYDEQFKKQFDINIPSDRDSKYVRFVYNFFIVQYTPLSRTRAKVRIANNVDLKFKYLPYFLLYRSTVKFGVDYFKNVIKVNDKFKNSEWEKKIKENPDLYGYFREKINQRFPQQ